MRQFPTIDLLLMGADRQPEDCSPDELETAKIIDSAWTLYKQGERTKLTALCIACERLMRDVDRSVKE